MSDVPVPSVNGPFIENDLPTVPYRTRSLRHTLGKDRVSTLKP